MRARLPIRSGIRLRQAAALAVLLMTAALFCPAQAPTAEPQAAPSVVLDRAVAVVNRRVILASDLDDEIRLSVLIPAPVSTRGLSRQQALDQLISRALIEQQIRQEDMLAIEPTPDEVRARVDEVRRQLPACVHSNCASGAGWTAFLAARGLTPARVATYLRYRIEILRFIEQRFRQGIQISQQQVETYYRETLLPQYAPGETIPPLDNVSQRIQEILLEQQVNVLFDNWLANLRQQGDIEVLDAELAGQAAPASAPDAAPIPSAPKKGTP